MALGLTIVRGRPHPASMCTAGCRAEAYRAKAGRARELRLLGKPAQASVLLARGLARLPRSRTADDHSHCPLRPAALDRPRGMP